MNLNESIHKVTASLSPTVLTIFGATGDLSLHYLLPALLHMEDEGLLARNFSIVCVARRDLTVKQLLEMVIQSNKGITFSKKSLAALQGRIQYYRANFDEPKTFQKLSELMADVKNGKHACSNRLYYFATAPQYFENLTHILKNNGLLGSERKFSRKRLI